MSSIESYLARGLSSDLEVEFMDARTLVTEAKHKLEVTGYPSKEQEQAILEEARNLFQEQEQQKEGSDRLLLEDGDSSAFSTETTAATSTTTTSCSSNHDDDSKRSKFQFWSTRRR